jgi:hypothetical protein
MEPFNEFIKVFLKIALIILLITIRPVSSNKTYETEEASFNQIEMKDVDRVDRWRPRSLGIWLAVPDVIICDGAPVSLERVESAISWWTDRGYLFGDIIQKQPGETCHESGVDGFITIESAGSGFDASYMAITHIKSNNVSGEILAARVTILFNGNRERLLEHEIGHALGWRHCNRRGHIMHPYMSQGGWNDSHVSLVED